MKNFLNVKNIKFKAIICFTIFFESIIFAQELSPKVKFIKGNFKDKQIAVKQAALLGDYKLAYDALNFCLSSKQILGNDKDLETLVLESLNVLSNNANNDFSNANFAEKDGNLSLGSVFSAIFNNFDSDEIRTKILVLFKENPSVANVSLVNNFVSENMQTAGEMSGALIEAIKGFEFYGNNTSFRLLFIADILEVWPEYDEILENSYGTLAIYSENEILHILSSVPVEKKITILEKLNKNSKISQKIRGEVAENALSQSINYIGGNLNTESEFSQEDLHLQKLALDTISLTKWTRASELANEYFEIAKKQYELKNISAESFSQIIKDISSVATSKTDKILSKYLDFLNKSAEQNLPLDMNVVLSVINALGDLGNKAAFDYLLYVTYLDYPEEVTTAARNALAKLKW